METIGERIRKLREERGFKQKEIAAFLQLNSNTYCRYEKGERTPPPEVIAKLAEFYGITTDYILTGKVGNKSGQAQVLNKKEQPNEIELWDFIENHSNLKLMGHPLDEEAKSDILLALRTALEYIKREKKRKSRPDDG